MCLSVSEYRMSTQRMCAAVTPLEPSLLPSIDSSTDGAAGGIRDDDDEDYYDDAIGVDRLIPSLIRKRFSVMDSNVSSNDSTRVPVKERNGCGSSSLSVARDEVLSLTLDEGRHSVPSSVTPENLQSACTPLKSQRPLDKPDTSRLSPSSAPSAISGLSPPPSAQLNSEGANDAFGESPGSPVQATPLEPQEELCGIEAFKMFAIGVHDSVAESALPQRACQQQIARLTELYYKGLEKRKKKEEEWEAARAARDMELQKFSFVPKITKMAKSIPRSGTVPACYKSDTGLRHRLLLEAWTSESSEQCRGTPRICKGSERIVHSVRGRSATVIPVAERLHLDWARRRWRREEEESKCQFPVLTRTPSEIRARIDGLYAYEAKRQLTLEKLRENADAHLHQNALRVNSSEVVKRLVQPLPKKGSDRSGEENLTFAPKLNRATANLSLRARRRRLEEWFRYWCQHHNSIDSTGLVAVERMREAVREANLPEGFCMNAFVDALDKYEKTHGAQIWHSTLPPSVPYIDKELTFSPRIGLTRQRRKGADGSPHQRLFQEAKAKQIVSRERERKEQEALFAESEKRKRKNLHALSKQRAKSLGSQDKNTAGNSQMSSVCSESARSQNPISTHGSLASSQRSKTCGGANSTRRSFYELSTRLFPHIFTAAEDLRSLIDAPRLAEARCSSSPTLINQNDSVAASSTQSSFAAEVSEVMEDCRVSLNLKTKRKRNRHFTGLPFSSDVLLECALSRPTWSSDVAVRRSERRENCRRLRALGKALYQMM